MTNPMPQMQQEPDSTGPLPNSWSADRYAELRPIWQNALRFRRGETRSGRKYSADEVNDYVRQKIQRVIGQNGMPWLRSMASEHANPNSPFSLLTDVVMATQNEADQQQALTPPTQGERNVDQMTTLTNAMGLNIPRMISSDTRDVLKRHEARAPNEAMVGGLVGSLPTFAVGSAAAGPNLLKQFLANGLMGATYQAGNVLPDANSPEQKSQADQSIAMAGGISGLLGAATSGLPRVGAEKFGRTGPAAAMGEEMLARAGGTGGLEAAASQMGTPDVPPTLAELSPEFAGGVQQVRQMNRTASQGMTNDAQALLAQVGEAKRAIQARYTALNKPINTAVVRQVLARQEVRDVLEELSGRGVGLPKAKTGRSLNDLRMVLRDEADHLFDQGGAANVRVAKALAKASEDLNGQLIEHVPEFAKIQADVAPYIRRELRLRRMVRTIGGPGVDAGEEATLLAGRGGRIPVGRTGLLHDAERQVGMLPYQRQWLAGRELGPHLLRPAAPDALVAGLHGLWPGYTNPAIPGLVTGGYQSWATRRRNRKKLDTLLR